MTISIDRGYSAIKKLIDLYISENNIAYKVSNDAPNNYKAMRNFKDENGYFLIYNGGDHGYLGEEYNIKFRAVHDFMHYKYNLSFKFEDEKILSDITVFIFRRMYDKKHDFKRMSKHIGDILNAEIKGQIEYYEKNKEYVKNQKEFIKTYLGVA